MTQALLFVALHLVGVAIALAIGRSRAPLQACAVGFPIGLAVVVLVLLLALAVGLPYQPVLVAVLVAALAGGAVLAAARRGQLTRSAGRIVAVWTLVFAAAAFLICRLNLSRMSVDSYNFIYMGRVLGDTVQLDELLRDLQEWGAFQIVAHSLHRFTRQDYLYALQPMLGLSFLPIFVLALVDAGRVLGVAPSRAVVALTTAALFTLATLQHHFFYIHTNLSSAIYLFLFVATFWRAEASGDPSGLGVGFLALLAFSFQRVEGPLFSLVVMTLAVLPTALPRRAITPWLAIYAGAVAAWHLLLAGHAPESNGFLTPALCVLMAAFPVAFFGAWLAIAHPRIARLRPALAPVLAAVLVIALAAAFAAKPDHMLLSAELYARNLTELSIWRHTWIAVVLLFVAGLFLERPRAGRPIAYLIGLFFVMTLLLAVGRIPYRFGIGDSAERMTNHILPVLFFYVGAKLLIALPRPARPAEPGSVAA